MRIETLKEMVFGEGIILSISDKKAADVMENGKLMAKIYNITAPDRLNFEVYRDTDGKVYIIDHEDYAE